MTELIELPAFEPGSTEWVEQRRRMVGGSEIAPLLGLGKWESRFSLWHRKQGTIAPQADNPQMEWGRLLEPVIADKFAVEHPEADLHRVGSFTRSDRPWQLASPDRLYGNKLAALEVKTARDADGWGEPGTADIPVYYRAQCIWYLDVLDAEWCDVAVLIGGSDYREYRVRYDAAEAAYMREQAQEFIASLDAGERPRIDQHDATYQAVRELHPDIDGGDVELPAELARAYCTARADLAAATDEAKRLTSLVADHMGTARRATFLGEPIATRQARGDGTPYLVAARHLPTFEKAA